MTTTPKDTLSITMLPVDRLVDNPANPRGEVGDVGELAASISAQGIQQALVVTPADERGRHTLVIGHRRLAAARVAGLSRVPCIVRDMDDRAQAETMLVENIQREQLTALEEVRGYATLLDLGEDAARMAKATGRSVGSVRRRLKIAAIDPEKRAGLPAQMSFEQLEHIARYADEPDVQDKLIKAAGTDNWNMSLLNADKRRETQQWVELAKGAMAEHDLPTLPLGREHTWQDPDGWRRIQTFDLANTKDPAQALGQWLETHQDEKAEAIGLIDKGGAWDIKIVLFQRHSHQDEQDEQAEAAARQQDWEAEDAAREAELAPARHIDAASRTLRQRFAGRLLGLKRAPKDMGRGLALICILENSVRRPWLHDGNDLAEMWVAITGPGGAPLPDAAGPFEHGEQQTAFAVCLARVELEIDHCTWLDDNQRARLLRPLYQALQAVGYQSSDDERDALDGGPGPHAEPEPTDDGTADDQDQ